MSKDSHDIYLGLGTNLGDKEENIRHAINLLQNEIGEVVAVSQMYETEPVGFCSENNFINAACHIKTIMSPQELLKATKKIEKQMGRKSKSVNKAYADRIIDIDLLMYDNLIFESDELTLPHSHLHKRAFVLHPLADIAADIMHSILHKTIKDLKDIFDKRES